MAEEERKAPIDETEVINTEELRVVLKEVILKLQFTSCSFSFIYKRIYGIII